MQSQHPLSTYEPHADNTATGTHTVNESDAPTRYLSSAEDARLLAAYHVVHPSAAANAQMQQQQQQQQELQQQSAVGMQQQALAHAIYAQQQQRAPSPTSASAAVSAPSFNAVSPSSLLQQQQQQHPYMSMQQNIHPSQPTSSSASSSPSHSLTAGMSADPLTVLDLRILHENALVGAIIGRAGITIKQIREQSGAAVSVQQQEYRQGTERIMNIKGTTPQIAMAAKLIAQILIDAMSRREERDVDSAQIRLLIHKTGVGAVIGKGGLTIKCLAFGTQVRLADGRDVPVESVKTGMQLVGQDGEAVAVTAAEEGYSDEMFKIAYESGTHTVTPDHLVTVCWRSDPTVRVCSSGEEEHTVHISWQDQFSLAHASEQAWTFTSAEMREAGLDRSSLYQYAIWWLQREQNAGRIHLLRCGDIFDVRAHQLPQLMQREAFKTSVAIPMVCTDRASGRSTVTAAAKNDACIESSTVKQGSCDSEVPTATINACVDIDHASLMRLFVNELRADASVQQRQQQRESATSGITSQVVASSSSQSLTYREQQPTDSVRVVYMLPTSTPATVKAVADEHFPFALRQLQRAWSDWQIDAAEAGILLLQVTDERSHVAAMMAAFASQTNVIVAFGDAMRKAWLQHWRVLPSFTAGRVVFDCNGRQQLILTHASGATTTVIFAGHPSFYWQFDSVLEAVAIAHDIPYTWEQLSAKIAAYRLCSPLHTVARASASRYMAIEVAGNEKRFVLSDGALTHNSIQSTSGARVQVANETLPHSSEKTITVTGSANQIYAAMIRVCQELIEHPLRPGTRVYPYQPQTLSSYAPVPTYIGSSATGIGSMPMSGGSGYSPTSASAPAQMPLYHPSPAAPAPAMPQPPPGAFGRPPVAPAPMLRAAPSPPPTLSVGVQKIAIPTQCAGLLIGKQGATIQELRSQSGCAISIADVDPSLPNERVVTVSGTAQGIQTAVFLIRQLVEGYQPPQQHQQQPTMHFGQTR